MPGTSTIYDDIYLSVKNSTIKGGINLGVFESALFENCNLESYIDTHIDVKFKDCNFSVNDLKIWEGIVTFENCKYYDTLITEENVSTLFSIEILNGKTIKDCITVM